jgi:hypothetical protein
MGISINDVVVKTSILDERNMSMKQWWNDADRETEVLGDKKNLSQCHSISQDPIWRRMRSNSGLVVAGSHETTFVMAGFVRFYWFVASKLWRIR